MVSHISEGCHRDQFQEYENQEFQQLLIIIIMLILVDNSIEPLPVEIPAPVITRILFAERQTDISLVVIVQCKNYITYITGNRKKKWFTVVYLMNDIIGIIIKSM